jgi:uncharacterized protein
MKRNLVLALASFLLVVSLVACSATPAATSSAAVLPVRTVSSTGDGEVYLVPDLAYVYVGVRVEGDDVATALSNNNVQANAVAQAVIALGVEAKDIQTSNFNVYPTQDYGPDGTVVRNYYVVENTIYITVRDLTKLGEMLDAVVRSGANTINNISFDVSDKDAAIAQARDLAIQKAMVEAEAIAATSGVKLGELQSVNVYVNNSGTPIYEAKGGAYMDAASSVPVSAGQLLVSVTANMVYGIK